MEDTQLILDIMSKQQIQSKKEDNINQRANTNVSNDQPRHPLLSSFLFSHKQIDNSYNRWNVIASWFSPPKSMN